MSSDRPLPASPSTEKEVLYETGLHTVTPERHNYPEAIHYPDKSDPEPVSSISPLSPWPTTVGSLPPPTAKEELPPKPKRRLGRKTIYGIIIALVVIIAAAVGGGVGAATARAKSQPAEATER